jgi:hypothetical protein
VSRSAFLDIAVDPRRAMGLRRDACNQDRDAGGRCPACKTVAVAPASSEYRGNGFIRHHWQCNACSHRWITVLQVPAGQS